VAEPAMATPPIIESAIATLLSIFTIIGIPPLVIRHVTEKTYTSELGSGARGF